MLTHIFSGNLGTLVRKLELKMNKSKWQTVAVLFLITLSIIVISTTQANAQDGIVRYLEAQFKEQNISVSEITVLNASPLRLLIIVQSADEWSSTEDSIMLNAVDRTVFIYARQEGFKVESLVKVLQDKDGNQLDYSDKTVDSERLDTMLAAQDSPLALSDKETASLLSERIDPFLDEYDLRDIPFVLNVTSVGGFQTVNLELQTSTIDVANKAAFFFWSLPHFSLFEELNTGGAHIALYKAKITDENGVKLFDYLYDFQLGSGGWTQDERLVELGGNSAPSIP